MKLRNLKTIDIIFSLLAVMVLGPMPLMASERYVIEENNTTINIFDADISEAIALGASPAHCNEDRGNTGICMAGTSYRGEEAISLGVSHTSTGGSSISAAAAKANGGSDFLFKVQAGIQF